MTNHRICLIGDVLIDVSLRTTETDIKLRMGGIIHAARGLWAMGVSFSVGYFAPQYLDKQIIDFLEAHNCDDITKLGNVKGTPYVFLIDDVKESGNQGYEFILHEEIEIEYDKIAISTFKDKAIDDFFLISGNYNIKEIVSILNLESNIHIDIANNVHDLSYFNVFKNKLATIFISTSSNVFQIFYKNNFIEFCEKFEKYTERIILKENRGGSRAISFLQRNIINIPSQTKSIIHSVGVGDVYDAVFINFYKSKTMEESLTLSSWIAMEYASTTFPDDFQKSVSRIIKVDLDELIKMPGVSLPWELRSNINIYIAAPDFDFVDVSPIDKLVASLEYHNFKARRPVKENGQMEVKATKPRRRELFTRDMVILNECSILIAVLLYNDPGTLIEIGISATKNIPTIVYDPYKIAQNCMLTELPLLVSSDLDEIIAEVFNISVKI